MPSRICLSRWRVVAIEIDKHFVFGELGGATRHLPLFVNTDIGLVQFVNGIVNDDVNLSAVFKIEQSGNFITYILCCFDGILRYILSALIKVCYKIIALVILKSEVFVLHPVLSKGNGVGLCGQSNLQQQKQQERATYKSNFHPVHQLSENVSKEYLFCGNK
jgi:hypothetical protein